MQQWQYSVPQIGLLTVKAWCRTPEDIQDVQREVEIMHHLAGHANITRLKGSYEDKGNVHLVMELCSGGELFDRIVQRGHYTCACSP